MTRPRVLVAGPDRQNDYLRTYCLAVETAGGEPVRAWPDAEALSRPDGLTAFAAAFAGVVLPGGVDVDPARYGEPPHPKLGTIDAELDEVHMLLARLALSTDWPTLAICRGAQVLGVAAGGTLYQDIPSQRRSDVVHRVSDPLDPKGALAHEVFLDPASRCAQFVGATRLAVNSRHHQAVREDSVGVVGSLRIVGRAPDGLVEAIEHPDLAFVLGVQWHPENLVATRSEALSLFRAHVGACRHASCRVGA